jgi:serine/threonine-protein kinase RIO1
MGDKSLKSKQRDQKHKDAAKVEVVAVAKAKQAGNVRAPKPVVKAAR